MSNEKKRTIDLVKEAFDQRPECTVTVTLNKTWGKPFKQTHAKIFCTSKVGQLIDVEADNLEDALEKALEIVKQRGGTNM